MNNDLERNLGVQPIAKIMEDESLNAQQLVSGSKQHITHKMVSRACKGRRLTPHVRLKIRDALNAVTGKEYVLEDLFNYQKPKEGSV